MKLSIWEGAEPLPSRRLGWWRNWSPPNAEYPPPKAGEPRLHRAARLGDHESIRALIALGTPVDELFDIALDPGALTEQATPLMVAAGSADGATVETVRLLLDNGASVVKAPSGVSALWYAASGLGWNYPPGGDADRVAELLRAGSDPNITRPARRGSGTSVLARAASTGDANRVRLLLQAGADPAPEGAEPPNQVPLYQAAKSGSVECVQLLIEAGAPVDAPVADNDEPVIASANSAAVLTALLVAGADPNAPCGYCHSVASRISTNPTSVDERPKMLRTLVAAGVDLDGQTDGSTALFRAAMESDQAVEALLAAGANPLVDPRPMSAVCFGWHEEPSPSVERIVDLLVAAGIDPDDTDGNGYRPLHAALAPDTYGPGYQSSDGFNVSATIALIRHGASIDITYPETGYRPLHAAAAAPSDTIVRLLLSAGSDPTERTLAGATPRDVARQTMDQLTQSPPSYEKAAKVHKNEASAQRLFEQWQTTHQVRIVRARRCVAMLEEAEANRHPT